MATTKTQRREKNLREGNITQAQFDQDAFKNRGDVFTNKTTKQTYSRGGKEINAPANPNVSNVPEGYRYDKKRDKNFVIPGGVADTNSPNSLTSQIGQPAGYQMVNGELKPIPGGVADPQTSDELFEKPEQEPTVLETIGTEMEESGKTYEEQATEIQKGEYLTFAQTYEDLLGKAAPFKTQEEYLDWRSKQSKENLDYLDKQQTLARELETSQVGEFRSQMGGAIAGTTAAMAQGREGATSGTAPMFAQEFTTQMRRKEKQLIIQTQSAEAARRKARADLVKAQEAGDMDVVEAIQGQIASIESELRQIDTEALQAATLANEQAMKEMEVASAKSVSVSESIFNLGSIAKDLTGDKLEAMIVGTDLTIDQAYLIRDAAVLQGQAEESKDELERAKLEAQAQDLLATAGKTTGQLDLEYFEKLDDDQQEQYIRLKMANNGTAIVDMGNGKYGAYDAATNTFSLLYDRKTSVGGGGAFEGTSGTGADALNVADGTVLERGECGMFVNDHTGLGVGTLYADKLNKMNPELAGAEAQAGDVFLTKYKDTGHCGFVLSNNGDGTVTVKDSNFVAKNTVGTHDINISEITGLARAEVVGGDIEAQELARITQEYTDAGVDDDKAYIAAKEEVENNKKKQNKVKSQVMSNEVAIETIDNILGDMSWFDTGFIGKKLTEYGGTDAYDIAAKLETVKAIVGFDKLSQMRENSVTGGALGQVSDNENRLLQAVWGSLDVGQSRDEFEESLGKVRASLIRINEAAGEDYLDYDGTGSMMSGVTTTQGQLDADDALYEEARVNAEQLPESIDQLKY